MISALIGSFIGLFTRALPEIFKYLDKRNERKHELAMVQEQVKLINAQGAVKVQEIKTQGEADYDVAAMEALKTAIQEQGKLTGFTWVDTINALIRPIITFQWVIILYPSVIVATFVLMLLSLETITTQGILMVLNASFGEVEKGICAGIINFFFLHRVLRKV